MDIEIAYKKKSSLLQIYGIFHYTGELSTEVDDTHRGYPVNYVTMNYSTCKFYVKIAMFHVKYDFDPSVTSLKMIESLYTSARPPAFLFVCLGCEQIL